jgi:hypothetical protein
MVAEKGANFFWVAGGADSGEGHNPVPEAYLPSPERSRLAVLFFLLAHALGLWSINFSSVLRHRGYESLVEICGPAGVLNAVAAMCSPLFIGALADQRFSSERVLRWLGVGCMAALSALFWAIEHRYAASTVLVLAGINALVSVPTFGLATSLVTSRLVNLKREFGPVRAFATLGWMLAGVVVSFVLQADHSTLSGYAAVVAWGLSVAMTFALKPIPPPASQEARSWRSLLGLEAWGLLRDPTHRVVFFGAALLNAPLVAYTLHTHPHLEQLGVSHSTAFMSIGQIMETIGLFGLAWMVSRFRLKWLFLAGIGVAVLRFVLFYQSTAWSLGAGIFLHGICFTLFYMTAQVYLDERVPGTMRARAQALFSLMMSGLGNLIGALGCRWWLGLCSNGGITDWPRYWGGLAGVVAVIFLWFALSYRSKAVA